MKKVIFIVSLLALLWGCKKEKIEPVFDTTPKSQTGIYDQPSKAEIIFSTGIKKTLTFTYTPDGLVKTIETFADSNKNQTKTLQQEFAYVDGNISLIKSTKYTNGHPNEPDLELFTYDNNLLKTYRLKYGIELKPYYENESLTYYYDSSNNISYALKDSAGIIKDSIAYEINKSSTGIDCRTLVFYDKEKGDNLDSILNGYRSYSYFKGGWYANKSGMGLHCPTPTPCYSNFAYSPIQYKFQRKVINALNTHLIYNMSNYELDIAVDENHLNYLIQKNSTNRSANKYEYTINDKGEITKMKNLFADVNSGLNNFKEQVTITISY